MTTNRALAVDDRSAELIDLDQARSRREAPSPIDEFLGRLCGEPRLLEAFRRDPRGTARACGVELSADALAQMRELEQDAVTDVVLAPPAAIKTASWGGDEE